MSASAAHGGHNKLETEPRISKYARVNWMIIHSTLRWRPTGIF